MVGLKNLLGFATANSFIKNNFLSGKEGAWYVNVIYNNKSYKAICGICKRGDNHILETHILEFDEDIYDKKIRIQFKYKIRGLIIFKNLEESKGQIEKDIEFAKNYKTCDNCKFCVFSDYGYSNYTVEGTSVSCLVEKFDVYDQSSDDYKLGFATTCDYYNEGQPWELDVDGEVPAATEDWIKSEIRDVKIKKFLE